MTQRTGIASSMPCAALPVLLVVVASCYVDGEPPRTAVGTDARIDAAFFAQTHVQRPDDPLFKLVGDRAALIKVHVVSPTRARAPAVSASLSLGGRTGTLALRGPSKLPVSIPLEPGVVRHRFGDSFTAMIPKEWIRPGLRITVRAGSEERSFAHLRIGAPTVVNMTMFDVHFFDYDRRDYDEGWEEEIEAKWPVARLDVQRVPGIVFKELVVPPRGGAPATRARSVQEYRKKTGIGFDGEQGTAQVWRSALQRAGGMGRVSLFYVNIHNVPAGGAAWDFGGVGGAGRTGLLHHELGHALGLPHLINDPNYPYVGTIHGIPGQGPHVGPTWGFDARPGLPGAEPGLPYFIPPVVQEDAVGWTPGMWKRDPMQGGGDGDQEKGFLLRMFSDHSAHKMQRYLEGKVAVWNEALGGFAAWDDGSKSYGKRLAADGVSLPVERDVEVYSVIAGVSALAPEANIVYPPVGPYRSGLIRLFDPSVPEDRADAARLLHADEGCDVSLRVTQGGRTRTFMLPIEWKPGIDPKTPWLYAGGGVNLPARDGKITRAELLLTPDAEANGLPAQPQVLDVWAYDPTEAPVDTSPFRAYFKHPTSGERFPTGDAVYVVIEAKDDESGIEDIELSVDGRPATTRDAGPWEWGMSDDVPLPELAPGGHRLEALVRSKGGATKALAVTFAVDEH